jgi:NADPH-dependent 2,4-dienoyl-CoA reductase/sulfur reductase-like enzyme/nitrite reductase/ring-hydroxylating ferredoxin subunit
MGGNSEQLTGPDLTQGIADSDLAEGSVLLGHAAGEPVILARIDGVVMAVDAKCTHYGGPLAEGLVDGDTIRCPWHHACFSLRSGEAIRPPALADLGRWAVLAEAGRVRVTGRAAAPRPGRTPRRSPDPVLIVGAGAAGAAAAETLRREGYDGTVAMIDPDPDSPYDRPNLSKDYLAGKAPEEWIPLHPAEFYADRGIERVRATATVISTDQRVIELSDGTRRSYGALILAPGAEPVRLPVPVAEGGRVRYLRSLADSRAIIAAAGNGGAAVVIGASFIGLEVAASLRQRGLEVHVVAPEAIPLARVMGPELGAFVRRLHESKGVVFHLGRTVKAVAAGHVTLDDGTLLDAGLVVAGVGVRPRVGLAQSTGLHVEDGIVVNAFLETSAPDVWAAGDAVRWPEPRAGGHVRVEHWVVAQRMGQAAARNVLGAKRPFTDVPFFWSQHWDAVIAYVGHAPDWDRASMDGDPDSLDCAVTFSRGGRRLALASIFRDALSLRTELEMEREAAPRV